MTFTTWLEHAIQVVTEAGISGEASTVGFNFTIAILSTVIAVSAIAVSWYLYMRRAKDLEKLPLNKRADDPLRPMLGPVYTLLENKYWVDEFYGYVVVKPYQWLSKFLAEKVDGAFWHDFFHDTVLGSQF